MYNMYVVEAQKLSHTTIIVSTGGIQWILWFSVRYTAVATRTEIFVIDALRGKLHQLGSSNLQGIFIGR